MVKKTTNIGRACPTCGETDPDNFYKDSARGIQTYCKDCSRERKREWASKNRDRVSAANKRYMEALRADPTRWTKYVRERAKKAYLLRLTDQVVTANRRARKYGVKGKLTTKEWRRLVLDTEVCPACRHPWQLVGRPILDHIVSLSRRGKNIIENIQPLCKYCHANKIVSVHRFQKKRQDENTKAASKRSKKVAN